MSKLYTKVINVKGHKNYEVKIEEYASANDVATDCETRQKTSRQFDDSLRYDDWTGVKSHEQTMDFLRNGYEPVISKLKDKLKIKARGEAKRISFSNNIQGFTPIVPLALKGVPNSMVDMRMKPIKNKVIDIYYDITCSCGTSSEKIIENGSNILGALMELEAQGYKFNLYVVQTYSDDRDCDMLVVKIKSSNQPFDLKRMSFPLTHTAFFRVVGFDWYSKCPTARYRSCYGTSLSTTLEDKVDEGMKQLFGNNAVFFSGMRIKNQGQEHIKEVLLNAGKGKI